jgi:hypothetical protein
MLTGAARRRNARSRAASHQPPARAGAAAAGAVALVAPRPAERVTGLDETEPERLAAVLAAGPAAVGARA